MKYILSVFKSKKGRKVTLTISYEYNYLLRYGSIPMYEISLTKRGVLPFYVCMA